MFKFMLMVLLISFSWAQLIFKLMSLLIISLIMAFLTFKKTGMGMLTTMIIMLFFGGIIILFSFSILKVKKMESKFNWVSLKVFVFFFFLITQTLSNLKVKTEKKTWNFSEDISSNLNIFILLWTGTIMIILLALLVSRIGMKWGGTLRMLY